tara:strand:+ start:2644 stop:3231 length:588 start_codon:yes stop_codon:yes gene_type:complete
MSVRIYKLGGSGNSGVLGVHSLVKIDSTQNTSQSLNALTLVNHSTTLNAVKTAPYIPNQNIDANTFFIYVTSPSSGNLARIMVYSDLNGLPDNLLYSSIDLSLTGGGIKTTPKAGFSFVAGTTYWLAVQVNTGSAGLHGIPLGSLLPISNNSTDGNAYSVYSALGTYASGAQASFSLYTSPTYTTDSMPFVGITA